jgi:hypothetical protein
MEKLEAFQTAEMLSVLKPAQKNNKSIGFGFVNTMCVLKRYIFLLNR